MTPVDPALAVPDTMPSTCGCQNPGLVRLRQLMASGMGQREASRLLWSPTVAEWVRMELQVRLPWLRLEGVPS